MTTISFLLPLPNTQIQENDHPISEVWWKVGCTSLQDHKIEQKL